MKEKSSNGTATQGVGLPNMTKEDALRMINRDLPTAIACLQAIQSDPDMKDLLAQFMVGRWENYKNRPDKNQGNLFEEAAKEE